MEEELANLNIADDEEDPIHDLEDEEEVNDEFSLCLVGRVLTNSTVHFPSMRTVLAELWHPIEGVLITEIKDKRVLFRFYNEMDLKRVLDGIPFFFTRHLILLYRLERGEDPIQVQLIHTNFWVHIRNLPIGFMSKGMVRQLGNFIGHFLEYDATIITRGIKKFMRLKVCLIFGVH